MVVISAASGARGARDGKLHYLSACARIAELERLDEDAHAHFGLRGLLLATFAKPSTEFTKCLPSFFAFVSGLWLKTVAGPRDGENKKRGGVKRNP